MPDWSRDLSAALASGDPEYMKAMLAQVPHDVLHMAIPYLVQLAQGSARSGKLELSLTYYDQLIQAAPGRIDWQADRVRILLRLDRHAQALAAAERIAEMAPDSALGYCLQADACAAAGQLPQALAALRQALRCEPEDEVIRQRADLLATGLKEAAGPDAPPEARPVVFAPPPKVAFDPALFYAPSIPSWFDPVRVEGLRQHLRRHSGQISARNAIGRLEDPAWLAAWDAALATTAGLRVWLQGSELGVFALRALHHGAAHALCAEPFPLDTRIATGVAQTRFLTRWRALHGAAIPGWSEEERRASFEEFAGAIDIVMAGAQAPLDVRCDCFVFPQIDHTLLGTGIIKAVRGYCAGRAAPARVMPAKATVYAMGIQWMYPGAAFQLAPMNRLRWSMYPQALDLGPEFWKARTEPVRCGEIDFANFSEATWDIVLPVTSDGTVDAVVYWFDLDLGNVRISNEPGGQLQCIKPAVQYTDPIAVRSAGSVNVRARVEESRLFFQALPPPVLQRTYSLPSWYVPMLGDRYRNDAYEAAIGAALAGNPAELVLDIGSGCGLLSMMAVQAGAQQVVGCETHPAILEAGREIVALNGMQERIAMVGKDCRKMRIPEDLPRRASLALFELFDCSLIGEGILHFLAYARTHLLAQNARYLPAGARIRAMVVEYRLDQIWDVDARLLNPYRSSPAFINVDAAKLPHRALSEPFDVFDFDFASAGPAPEEKRLHPAAIRPGVAGAVLFWFDLRLDDTRWISNDPRAEDGLHWKQGLKILPEVHVDRDTALPLVARHDGNCLDFQWQAGELRREALSKVPRCDLRWLAASGELEQQTRSLLQHCSQRPDEYAKVAEIAKRFAVDPGAHGIDPTIAHRFASMFLN